MLVRRMVVSLWQSRVAKIVSRGQGASEARAEGTFVREHAPQRVTPPSQMRPKRMGVALVVLACAYGCFAPASPTIRVSDAAHDLNVATRFGKMELAVSHVDTSVRTDFMARRSQWGREIRIIDIDLGSVELRDETHAIVTVDVSWVPLRDNMLRSTRVTQTWEDKGHGWKLAREVRGAGDQGLFGEVLELADTPQPDVHLPSRTLKPQDPSE